MNSPTSAAPIIIGRSLHKVYELEEQEVLGLDNVSLEVKQGEFVAIMGPSGSGKSTLLHVLGGLDKISSGQLEIAHQRLDQMKSAALADFRRETIGFVFQAFYLVPTMSALENVALPGIFSQIPYDVRMERAAKLLSLLGLENRLDHLPKQLSGGQQQRVAIARALFNDPPIIMADEPTGALDSQTGMMVLKMLRSLCKRRNKTVLIVTHDRLIAQYADRVMVLRDGQVVLEYDNRETNPDGL